MPETDEDRIEKARRLLEGGHKVTVNLLREVEEIARRPARKDQLVTRAGAYEVLGVSRHLLGDTEQAETQLSNARTYYRKAGETRGEAAVLVHLAGLDRIQGRASDAGSKLDEADRLFQQEDCVVPGRSVLERARLEADQGQVCQVRRRLERAESMVIGEDFEAERRLQLGVLGCRVGSWAVARVELEASIRCFRSISNPRGEAQAKVELAVLARAEGRLQEAVQLLSEAKGLLPDATADLSLLQRASRELTYTDLESLDPLGGDADRLVSFAGELVREVRSLRVAGIALDEAEQLGATGWQHRRLRRKVVDLRRRPLLDAVKVLHAHAERWSRAVEGSDWQEAMGGTEERLMRSFIAGGEVLPLRRSEYLYYYVRTVYISQLKRTVDVDRAQRDVVEERQKRWIRIRTSPIGPRTTTADGPAAPLQQVARPPEEDDEALRREEEYRRRRAFDRAREVDAGPCPIHQQVRPRRRRYEIFVRAAREALDHPGDMEDGASLRSVLREQLRNVDADRYQAPPGASRQDHDRADQNLHRDLPCALWVLMTTAEGARMPHLARAVRSELLPVLIDATRYRLYECGRGRGNSDAVRAGLGWLQDLLGSLTADLRGQEKETTTLVKLQDNLKTLRGKARELTQDPETRSLALGVIAEADRLEALRETAYETAVLHRWDDLYGALLRLIHVGDPDLGYLRKTYGRLRRTALLVLVHGPRSELRRQLHRRLRELVDLLTNAADDCRQGNRCYRSTLRRLAADADTLADRFDPDDAGDDS